MFNKLKQFNDLRKQANDLKSILAKEEVTIESSAVKIVMDGNQEIKTITINNDYLQSGKKGQLEKEITDGINSAIKKVQRLMAEKMKDMGGFNIPGMN
jgi:DNA-binding protein YbaB